MIKTSSLLKLPNYQNNWWACQTLHIWNLMDVAKAVLMNSCFDMLYNVDAYEVQNWFVNDPTENYFCRIPIKLRSVSWSCEAPIANIAENSIGCHDNLIVLLDRFVIMLMVLMLIHSIIFNIIKINPFKEKQGFLEK